MQEVAEAGLKKATKELVKELVEEGAEKATKELAEKAAKETGEKAAKKKLPKVVTEEGFDPVGTRRNSAGRLIDEKTGRYAEDPKVKGKAIKPQYQRNMSERKKALLRDANDPNSGLSNRARKFILDNKGNKVPKGYEVSHEKPLYNTLVQQKERKN